MPDDEKHSRLFRVPEPLEKLFAGLEELERVAGGEARAEAGRVRSLLQTALAAEARGEVVEAVGGIMQAMQAIAMLAARLDPAEAREMSRVAEQFGRALLRGDAGEARNAAQTMRSRSGAKVVKEDE
jgi:hypothetical protein